MNLNDVLSRLTDKQLRRLLGAEAPKQVAGRWYRTPEGTPNQWEGQCGRCGSSKPAVELNHALRPFGKGEWWICTECL